VAYLGEAIEVYTNTAAIPSSGRLHFLIDQLQNIGARNRTSWLRLLRDPSMTQASARSSTSSSTRPIHIDFEPDPTTKIFSAVQG
jgi:hypothetical protein